MEISEGVIGLDLYNFSDDTKAEFNNCNIFCEDRYWHVIMLYTKSMIITVLSDDMSKECYF